MRLELWTVSLIYYRTRVSLLFPGEVSRQTQEGQNKPLDPEDCAGEQNRDDSFVFRREAKLRCDSCIDSYENHPDNHASGYRNNVVLGPNICDQASLPEYSCKNCRVQGSSPDPMTCNFTIAQWQIIPPDEL